MEFEFKSEVFEGPLDLMLHLIKKNKIDIYDIPISELADQFMEYVENFKEGSMDLCAEFLHVASDLFEIKSRMLLPMYENEVIEFDLEHDPRRELIERLLEYKKAVQRRDRLEELYHQFSDRFFREAKLKQNASGIKEELSKKIENRESDKNDESDRSDEVLIKEAQEEILEKDLIARALENVIRNMGEIDYVRNRFFEKLRQMQDRQISVEDKTKEIVTLFFASKRENLRFEELLTGGGHLEVIVTFLAILELMKAGMLTAFQTEEKIELKLKEKE